MSTSSEVEPMMPAAGLPETGAGWQQQFSATPADIGLPGDRPRTSPRVYRPGKQRQTIDRSLFQTLVSKLEVNDPALLAAGAVLLASVVALLSRLSAEGDLVISLGTMVTGCRCR